jgi:hypothetical protein
MFKKLLPLLITITTFSFNIKAQCPAAGTLGGADITVCVGSTATLAATLPVGYTGTWSKSTLFQFETITTTSSATSTVTGLVFATTVSEIWTVTNGTNCTGIKDTINIIVQSAPTSTNAGADKAICLGETISLNANAAPSGSTGTWSKLGGTNTATSVITNPNSNQSTVTGLNIGGADTLKWTVTNAVCAVSVFDKVVITTNNIQSNANAGPDRNGCVGDTLTLYASVVASGSPVWSRVGQNILNSGNIVFVPNANNDTVKVKLVTAGTYTLCFRVSECAKQDTMILTVNPSPTANISGSSSLTTCDMATTYTLNSNTPGAGETGVWSIKGSGTLTNITATSVQVSGLAKGTTTVIWTVSGTNGCSSSDKVTITVGASAGKDSTVCAGDSPFYLNGNVSVGWSASWSIQGSVGASINGNSASASTSVTFKTEGTFNLLFSVKDPVSGCESTDTMKITAVICLGTAVANTETESTTLTVYPNPTEGTFVVSQANTHANYSEIAVLTTDGRVVLHEQLGNVQNIQKTINLSGVAKGIYFIKVTKGEMSTFVKVAVQ